MITVWNKILWKLIKVALVKTTIIKSYKIKDTLARTCTRSPEYLVDLGFHQHINRNFQRRPSGKEAKDKIKT